MSGLSTPLNSKGLPGHVLIKTITFEEHDGKTKTTDTAHYQTIDDLDGMLQSGMEEGATETMDRLAELVGPALRKRVDSRKVDKCGTGALSAEFSKQ